MHIVSWIRTCHVYYNINNGCVFLFQPYNYPRSYSAMAREYDPMSDTLGMDNSRSYLGGRSLSGPDGMASLRDTAITGNSLDAEDRHRYLASRRFVGDYGLWKSLNQLTFTASAATTTTTTTTAATKTGVKRLKHNWTNSSAEIDKNWSEHPWTE